VRDFPPPRLIVTADDFGAATEVNEAVEHAHTHGVLTAASLMTGGAALDDAVARARRLPRLRVGLHVVLVEGRPVLPASALPDLVGPDGLFRCDMAACAVDIFFRPAARRQLLAEVTAQFERFAETGLALDHANTHKHFHLHPTIAGAILKIGPAWVTAPWSQLVRLRLERAGVRTADRVFGLAWSGAMTAPRLAGLIARAPVGLTEIYMHPATSGAFEGSAPGYRYTEELAALSDPAVKAAVAERRAVLGGFQDFGAAASDPSPVVSRRAA
jgi:predicted glycoside hydrolase/deacetylase ChbG (UPF0249 family)